MRDGYYLATYLQIGEIANIYRINLRHDFNMSLWLKEGNRISLVHYWELERVTGIKKHFIPIYDIDKAKDIINSLLKEHNLNLNDMNEVWGTPGLQTCNDYHSLVDYPQFSYHSIAHLYSAIMADSEKFYNENIIGLAVDSAPDVLCDHIQEKDFYVGCFVKKGQINMFSVYSPGWLWSISKNTYNLEEGTLMALASASTSEAYVPNKKIPLPKRLRDYQYTREYLDDLKKFIDGLSTEKSGQLFTGFDQRFSVEENKISMYMKEIQKISVNIMEMNINSIIEKYKVNTSETHLALSGGYALNCPTNSFLMQKYQFKSLMTPPCVNDGGLSMGIALYTFSKQCSRVEFKLKHAYYGNKEKKASKELLSKYVKYIKNTSDFKPEQFVTDIENSVVIWVNGPSEIGPRALGNRSLLADPRTPLSKDKLNLIKGRQWWRPIAPIILESEIDNWFEQAYLSPFMLNTFRVLTNKSKLVPAITHLDNSARVQTLGFNENPLLFRAINAFYKITGIPILCNTSLNAKGEPIIDKVEEAIHFALVKKIQIGYFYGQRIELKAYDEYPFSEPLRRPIRIFDFNTESEKELIIKKINPHDVNTKTLTLRELNPYLKKKYDLTSINDCKELDRIAKITLMNINTTFLSM